MDNGTLQQAGVSSGLIAVALVLYRILLKINHRHIRSRCCGRTADVEVDIDGLNGSPQIKNESTSKDVGDVVRNNIKDSSTGETRHCNQIDGRRPESGPSAVSVGKDEGSLRSTRPSPELLNSGRSPANGEGKHTVDVPLPEHL